jgi:hypothetical protein
LDLDRQRTAFLVECVSFFFVIVFVSDSKHNLERKFALFGSPSKAKSARKNPSGRSLLQLSPPTRKLVWTTTIKQHVRKRPPPVVPAPPSESKARTRIRYTNGKRARRNIPLTHGDLYLTDARPGPAAPDVGHKCILCEGVKSHPVV